MCLDIVLQGAGHCKSVRTVLFIEYRDFKHFNEQNFLWNLASLSTLNLIHSDPNKSWISWKNKFLETVNMHAPVKKRKVSNS